MSVRSVQRWRRAWQDAGTEGLRSVGPVSRPKLSEALFTEIIRSCGMTRQGIGSAMLSWAEERIRRLVEKHGTARTAVIGAIALVSEQDATALLLAAGYRPVFSLVELELGDLQQLPEPGSELPAGKRTGPIGTSHYRAAWRTVADPYADTGFTQKWSFQDFVDTADPACWRAAWNGQDMLGVALFSIRSHDHTVGEVEELSVRTDQRRLGIGRILTSTVPRSVRGVVMRTKHSQTATKAPTAAR